jgi:FkbM family methyltransferase
MEKIIQKILLLDEFVRQPIVLLDIGASGKINPVWKKIAKYSYCIAFDADERDFQFTEKENGHYKKLFIYNSVVIEKENQAKVEFYLTKNPHCSSTLEPLNKNLKQYSFAGLFEVEKQIQLPAATLSKVLNDLKFDYIDWIKTDTQGTDLRLFKSLNQDIQNKIIVAEFEPGFIDAYKGEDTLADTLTYLFRGNFELIDICVKGPLKFRSDLFQNNFKTKWERKIAEHTIKKIPGWAELSFINTFNHLSLGRREYILGWLFSSIKGHHSIAHSIAQRGIDSSPDIFLEELKAISLRKMKWEMYSPRNLMLLVRLVFKRIFS